MFRYGLPGREDVTNDEDNNYRAERILRRFNECRRTSELAVRREI
jgi:hypothetical protein